MPFDGLFLHKMIGEIKIIETSRISKINQLSNNEFLFTLRLNQKNIKLLISLHAENCRVQITDRDYDIPYDPINLTMFLRKHFEGGIIKNISQLLSDRVMIITVIATNEIGDRVEKQIVVEFMGRRSNLLVLENNKILEAFHHNSPLDEGRTCVPGAIYEYPSIEGKIDTLLLTEINSIDDEFFSKATGLSKTIKKEIQAYPATVLEMQKKIEPTVFLDKNDYYFFDLKTQEGNRKHYESLSLLLDDFYYEKDTVFRVKQKSNDIANFIKKQIDKLINKKDKLLTDLKEAQNNDEYRIKGEIILANVHNLTNSSSVTLKNFYTNEDITISLDPLLTPTQNANKYFTKYQKAKKAICHITEQINSINNELDYFDELKVQIDLAGVFDAMQIKEELEEYGYLKKKSKARKKKKSIEIQTFHLDNATVYVGKNNLQNDYITHKLAKPQDMWFHVKDAPSAHVLLVGEVNEETIRFSANQAALNSKFAKSSSVPVDYTKIKFIKKIPQKKGCFVSISNQKTIYIDPEIKK